MKLKVHTPADHIAVSPKLPVMSFSPLNGRISFSTSAVAALGLKKDDRIILIQDEDRPKEWYLSRHPEGFKIMHNGGTLAVVNRSLCKAVTDSLEVECTVKIPIAIQHQDVEGRRLFAILTKGMLEIRARKPSRNRFADGT